MYYAGSPYDIACSPWNSPFKSSRGRKYSKTTLAITAVICCTSSLYFTHDEVSGQTTSGVYLHNGDSPRAQWFGHYQLEVLYGLCAPWAIHVERMYVFIGYILWYLLVLLLFLYLFCSTLTECELIKTDLRVSCLFLLSGLSVVNTMEWTPYQERGRSLN